MSARGSHWPAKHRLDQLGRSSYVVFWLLNQLSSATMKQVAPPSRFAVGGIRFVCSCSEMPFSLR